MMKLIYASFTQDNDHYDKVFFVTVTVFRI